MDNVILNIKKGKGNNMESILKSKFFWIIALIWVAYININEYSQDENDTLNYVWDGNIEGTYIEYFTGGGEPALVENITGNGAVKIVKNDNTYNIYLLEYWYEGYMIKAIAEDVPESKFGINKVVVLLGTNNAETYYVKFTSDGYVKTEDNLLVCGKKNIELDITEKIANFKSKYSYMNYKYSSYYQSIDILDIKTEDNNILGYISFNKKWYEQLAVFEGFTSIEIRKNNRSMIDILFDGVVYCSFFEDNYVLGENNSYFTYKCEDGTKFDFYMNYNDEGPVIRFNEIKEDFITDEIRESLNDIQQYIKYGDDFYLSKIRTINSSK